MKKHFMLLVALTVTLSAGAQNDSITLDNVVVTGTRNRTDVRHLPFTVYVIGRKKLTENYRPNILPTLTEQVPGLFTTARGILGYGVSTNAAGGLSMRGISGGSGQLMVLIDGTPQYQGVYGHPISDSYQTMMVERAEVLRGPASTLYGSNAMGGVINIVTRAMHQDGVRTNINLGAGSYGTVQTEVGNMIKSGKFSSTVAAQYGRTDNHRRNMGFEQYGGYIKLGYDFNEHWNAFADLDLTHFNASNPGPTSAPLYGSRQWITRGAATLALENHYNKTSGRIAFYDNFGRHKINDGSKNIDNPQTRYFRSKDALAGISWYQSARLFRGNRTTIGIDYQHIYGRAYYTDIATGEILETTNKQSAHSHRNEIAGYVDFRQDIVSWLTVDAGIRIDHHSITGNEWVPQGGFVIRPIKAGEFKATIGKGFRNPTMKDFYLYPPSNTDLKPESLMNYEIAWKQNLMGGDFSYGINLFYINGDNMIQTAVVDGRLRNVNTGKIENSGIELEANWRINDHWNINTNHSMLHMVHHVLAAPEYKGYAGVNWHNGKWSVSAGMQQIAGLITNTATDKKENFTLLNATVSYQALKNLGIWVKGDNLLAQKYEINEGFSMPRATFMGGINLSF